MAQRLDPMEERSLQNLRRHEAYDVYCGDAMC